eukprot:jgi/Tetstr1/420865/TSEL_011938.t1
MKDYERRVFDASSEKAAAIARVAAALVGRGRGRGRGAAVAGVAAKVSTSDGVVGRLSPEMLALCEVTFRSLTAQTLKSYADKLLQFGEFCHDLENTSPLEATTATVVRYVA